MVLGAGARVRLFLPCLPRPCHPIPAAHHPCNLVLAGAHLLPLLQVGQALSLSSATPGPWSQHALQQPQQQPMPLQPGMGGLAAELQQAAKTAAQPPAPLVPEDGVLHAGMGPGGKGTRVHVCSKDDTLRTVVERLATPGELLGRTGRWFGEDNWCHGVCCAPVSRGSWCAGCTSGYG